MESKFCQKASLSSLSAIPVYAALATAGYRPFAVADTFFTAMGGERKIAVAPCPLAAALRWNPCPVLPGI
tara:strand:+ start:993 stop:1202 length:210 start_codon:yes stop_codon:yes gene_type:complete